MTIRIQNGILSLLCALAVLFPVSTSAQSPEVRFNRENWFTIPHPTVATFTVLPDGSAYGTTTTDIPFRQYNVPNNEGLRIQRFEIQDHYHYIVEGRVVYTLPEISRQLALATP